MLAGHMMVQEVWYANIFDPCIIGLALLVCLGATIDVPGAALCLGIDMVVLLCDSGGLCHHLGARGGEVPTWRVKREARSFRGN